VPITSAPEDNKNRSEKQVDAALWRHAKKTAKPAPTMLYSGYLTH